MALLSMASASTSSVLVSAFAVGVLVLLSGLFYYLFHKPAFPNNAPKPAGESWPILGHFAFFTERWDFYQRASQNSKTGNFSFYAGQWPVVALSGVEDRKTFFEHKGLHFGDGYAALLAGAPTVKRDNNLLAQDHASNGDFGGYLAKRLITLLKGPQLKKGFPLILADARRSLDRLAAQPKNITDPFDSIYRMVFQFTMRTVACHEIANDEPLLAKCLHHFEAIEDSASSLAIMFPWMPTPGKTMRIWHGMQLYIIFKKVVDDRRQNGSKYDDALQHLLDEGDDINDVLQFVLASLFAGQLNSGINAAWILCYLADKPYWWNRVRDEVEGVANKYCLDASLPLKERLMRVPFEAWESEFPIIDICLKDSIRLQAAGTMFRKNNTGKDIPLSSGEVIPNGAYVTLAAGDMHLNPAIYPNPAEWDPSRYLPEKQEDKKEQYAWMGWGLARHPCLGMRFAKLENNVIVAMFMAYFAEAQVCDAKGNVMDKVPTVNFNNHTAKKPDIPVFLKFQARQDGQA